MERAPMHNGLKIGHRKIRQEYIPISKLFVPDEYQRPYDERWAKRIADEFDESKLDNPRVAPRVGGQYAIQDGQHRIGAIRDLFGADAMVFCDVEAPASIDVEAQRFLAQDYQKKHLTPSAKMKARIVAGDEVAIGIVRLIESYGYRPNSHGGKQRDGEIKPTSLEHVLKRYPSRGMPLLDETLSVVRDAYGNDTAKVQVIVITAIAAFINRWAADPAYSRSNLIKTLSRIDPGRLIRSTTSIAENERMSRDNAGKITIQRAYNERLRSNRLVDRGEA